MSKLAKTLTHDPVGRANLNKKSADREAADILGKLRQWAGVDGPAVTLENVIGWVREGVKSAYRPSVMIAIPTRGIVQSDFVDGVFTKLQATRHPGDYYFMYKTSFVADQRNEIVRHFLDATRHEWLLMMDDDVVYTGQTDPIQQMIHAANTLDAQVVTAVCPVGGGNYHPNVGFYAGFNEATGKDEVNWVDDFDPNGVQWVDIAGGAFLLCHRSVFLQIDDPWFEYTSRSSEDAGFCIKLHQKGIRILADFRIELEHLRVKGINLRRDYVGAKVAARMMREFSDQVRKEQARETENVRASGLVVAHS